MNPLLKGFCVAARPPDRRTPWEWCEEHLVVDGTSPMPGRWRSDNSPWVREPMEAAADNRVRDVTVKCSAQSSKTQTVMGLAAWAIAEDPGPSMWVMANKDDVKQFVRDRIGPTFRACKPVSSRMVFDGVGDITFTTCPFYFVGAGSPAKLQSKPIRWLFLDEVRNYPEGALPTVLKRTRAFWNSRRFIISTPGKEGDEVDRAFLEGDQRTYHVRCPACDFLQPLAWESLKWDTTEETKPGGVWDFDKLADSIRYVCRDCGHQIRDTPAERKSLARRGQFVAMNPTAPRHKRSFHWNALLPPWVPWRSLVEEFIAARAATRKGDVEPMRTFVTESLGESWRDELGVIEDFGFLKDRQGAWRFGDPWPEEATRFMAADRQAAGGEHYWYVVRAVSRLGVSRLVAYGRVNSKLELEEARKQWSVPVTNAVIDSGFQASDVYRFCAATGWKPMKGDEADAFLWRDPNTKRAVRRLWQKVRVEPSLGRAGRVPAIPLYRWSNPGVKDLLFNLATGFIPGWELPGELGRDYFQQLSAETREETRDPRGHVRYRWVQRHKDNHLLDCELMILVALLAAGLLAPPTPAG